jgi:hypothetical protein
MAFKKVSQVEVQAFVASVLAARPDDGEGGIDEIEMEMEELADAVAAEFGKQRLARRVERLPEVPACPRCGQVGQVVGEHTRELLTTRGDVPLTEAECYCPACRRHFFPSVGSTGTGSVV